MTPSRIDIPHRHPFRFVATGERRSQGDGVDEQPGYFRVRLTHGGPWGRLDGGGFPAFFAIELMAQACAVILARDVETEADVQVGTGLLAGVSEFHLDSPLRVGDSLLIKAVRQGTFGMLTKVQSTIFRDDQVVAEAGLLLSGEGIA